MKRAGLLLVVAALVATSGCASFVTGSGPLDLSSEPAAIAPDAVNESNYEAMGQQSRTLNRNLTVAGQEREVHAEIHVASYARVAEGGGDSSASMGGTMLTLVSGPAVEVAGQSVNPLQSVPDSVIFGLLEQSGTEFNATVTGTKSVTMLGKETQATTYRITPSGQSGASNQSIVVERASVTHEGDLVLALVTYPEGGSGESAHRLLSEVVHPVNEST